MKILNLQRISAEHPYRRLSLLGLFLIVNLAVSIGYGSASESDEDNPGTAGFTAGLLEELREGSDYTVRALIYGSFQTIADSTQNPGNNFLRLPENSYTIEFRPDFRLIYQALDFSIKPRLICTRELVDHAMGEDSSGNTEAFINEWQAQARLNERLYVSLGRENLQWGPSFISSPSNPFFKDNGRRRLKSEVRGRDFAKAVWVPSGPLSVSFIANTGNGEQEIDEEFKNIYAVKIDFTGRSSYGSLIASHRTGDRDRIGAFGGTTLSDALLVYAEAMVQKGSEALYPVDSATAFGCSMEASRTHDDTIEGLAVLGGSYTLEAGPTLTLEYFFNSPGYNEEEADAYYTLRKNGADAFYLQETSIDEASQTLSLTVDPELRFLRQNYLMFQYVHSEINDVLSLTGRWLFNLDDQSNQLYGSLEYALGDHVELFVLGLMNSGGSDTEFGTFIDSQFMVGLEFVF